MGLSAAPGRRRRWVHVAAVGRGPNDMVLYQDGARVAATLAGTGGALTHSAAPARIGSYRLTDANRPWLGSLDEIRVYACALSDPEVAALAAAP